MPAPPLGVIPQAAIDGVVLVVAGDLDIEVKTIRNLENLDTDSVLERIARDVDDGRIDAAYLGVEILGNRQAVLEDMLDVISCAARRMFIENVVDVDILDTVVPEIADVVDESLLGREVVR